MIRSVILCCLLSAWLLINPSVSHAKSMLTDEEVQLVEEMQQAGFSHEQVNKAISMRISMREEKKSWTREELEELDSNLKSRWHEMVKALSNDDVETAVKYFDIKMREIHKLLLSAATPEQRGPVLQSLEDIKLVGVKGANQAEYKVKLPESRTLYNYSSDIVFERNDEGVWEIKSF